MGLSVLIEAAIGLMHHPIAPSLFCLSRCLREVWRVLSASAGIGQIAEITPVAPQWIGLPGMASTWACLMCYAWIASNSLMCVMTCSSVLRMLNAPSSLRVRKLMYESREIASRLLIEVLKSFLPRLTSAV